MALNINQRLNGLHSLSYLGDNAVQPPDFVTKARPPTANDSKNFALGDIWLDTTGYPNTLPTTNDVYILVALVGNQATWVNFGGGDLQTLTGNSGGPVPPTGGNINIVGDGVTTTVIGTPGTSTLTISVIGGPGSNSNFLYIQTTNAPNVTGDGTIYDLGSAVALTQIFDIGGNVFPGDGVGNPATFTAPVSGQYYLEVGVQLTNLLAGVFDDSYTIFSVTTPNRVYACEFSALGAFNANAMISDSGAMSQGYLVDLTAGDIVTFNCLSSLTTGGSGVKNIGVGGQADPVVTFICGFIVGASGSSSGSLQVITDSGIATESAGAIQILGTPGISTSGAGNTVTLTLDAQATAWSVITADQTASVDNGYICNKAGLLSLQLPAVSAVGDIVEVSGMNTAVGWRITQGPGQQIHFGDLNTTVGAPGYLESTQIYDSVRMVCNVANSSFIVLSSIGNITVV